MNNVNTGGASQVLIEQLEARIKELESQFDDYKSRWEATGCTRHYAMETAIELYEKSTAKIKELENEVDELKARNEDINDLTKALDFYNKVVSCNTDERIAVGTDHWDWLLSAVRNVVKHRSKK